jgi:hypothetical protein
MSLLHEALSIRVHAVEKMATVAGTKRHGLFSAIQAEAVATFKAATTAFDAYFKHIAQHGC